MAQVSSFGGDITQHMTEGLGWGWSCCAYTLVHSLARRFGEKDDLGF